MRYSKKHGKGHKRGHHAKRIKKYGTSRGGIRM